MNTFPESRVRAMSDADVKVKVARVCGLMGMPADESSKLIYSWEAVPNTTSHPIERRYVRIPDEQVAKVADRIAELEAEIAQLKAQDEWHDGIPSESGWYWVQVDGRSPEVGEFDLFDCGAMGMRWNLHLTGNEEPLRPEDVAVLKWKKIKLD